MESTFCHAHAPRLQAMVVKAGFGFDIFMLIEVITTYSLHICYLHTKLSSFSFGLITLDW